MFGVNPAICTFVPEYFDDGPEDGYSAGMANKKTVAVAETAGNRVRLAVAIPPELLERAKNAVFYTPGLTLAALTEVALVAQLEKMERKNGGPFPERTAALRVGRPLR